MVCHSGGRDLKHLQGVACKSEKNVQEEKLSALIVKVNFWFAATSLLPHNMQRFLLFSPFLHLERAGGQTGVFLEDKERLQSRKQEKI